MRTGNDIELRRMNDPWKTLALNASTATASDVEEACARLLKQKGEEGEEAQLLREARECALEAIREREESGGGTDDAVAAAAQEPHLVELPDAVRLAITEVQGAAASGNVEQLEAAMEALDRTCEAANLDGTARAGILEHACAGNVKVLAAGMSDQGLLRLVELGQANLPQLVLSAWLEAGWWERITRFGEALGGAAGRLATPEGAAVMARVGVLVGLERPALATALGDHARAHLPEDVRPKIMGQLEHEAALGAAFEDVPVEMRPFWFERLRHAAESHDWRNEESRHAVDGLIEHHPYTWRGWGIVKQLMPLGHWEPVEERLRAQAQQTQQAQQPTPAPAAEIATPARQLPRWIIPGAIAAVVVAVVGIGLLVSGGGDASPSQAAAADAATSADAHAAHTAKDVDERHERFEALQTGGAGPARKKEAATAAVPAPAPTPAPKSSVAAAPEPPEAKSGEAQPPSPAAEKKKSNEAYLRALQSGALFDGSYRPARQ